MDVELERGGESEEKKQDAVGEVEALHGVRGS